ncbi:uncharacterized protein [Scyliorhinus torazame]|uniref:uncharacterized protein isoform X2 n=1 Tax=Scyliorhinus torazame TaxID=75743 RepID=UPI003B5AF35E
MMVAVMDCAIWDSDGCTTSDSSDLPDIVSSDEDLKSWFPPNNAPQLSYEVLIPKRWCYLRMSVLKRYCHIVKVQLLGPILFGRPYLDERYRNWVAEAELIQYEHCDELQDLDLKTLKIIDLLESAHRALLVYALKRPLLIQFVRVVDENLVQCSTLEEAIQVVKQQKIFRAAWKTLTFGNKMQTAAVLALAGLHYFSLIKQYSMGHNDLFEQFEDQCFQEEERAKMFHKHWESDMKKQHYEAAVKSLNEAIRVCAFNHLLYEKRSYCYFQLCQYKKAWSDAKRCIVLRPHSIEGHYLFAGALCGKGWYTRALKANSLAVQVCQWKGLNVKGLTEQRELIQTEQILASKEKAAGNWEEDDISLKDQSCDSEGSTIEEDDDEDDVSSEDDDVIPTVESVDVWVKNNNKNTCSDGEQNQQAVHLDIPFLSMNFKASSSESENDSVGKLNQGQESKVSSEGDNYGSGSNDSLRQNQRDVGNPCNSLESDNLEKTVDIFVTEVPSSLSVDPEQVAFLPSTDPVNAASSSMDPSKDMFSSSVSTVVQPSSYESDLMSEEIDQAGSESMQNMLSDARKVQQKEQNTLQIPFLSMNFKASSSESENDSVGKLNQGQESKVSSEGDNYGSGSNDNLRQNQRGVGNPCNSLESDNLKKTVDLFVTEVPSSLSLDPEQVAFLPSTDPVNAASSSMDPSKDIISSSVSKVVLPLSYESDLMSEEINQASSERKQNMLSDVRKLQQKEQNTMQKEERLVKCKLKEASEALIASNFRNAQENYLNALKLIKEKKVYNLTTMEYILIEYTCGLSFLGNNLIQDILEAEQHFMKILEFKEEDSSRFNCLSYYGLSQVYLKWNRYKEARTTLEKSLTLVESDLVPGLRTWPGTDTVIEETRDGVLKELLKSLLKECLCPPRPDAVCHYQFCYTHNNKCDIYKSDPDFKGFVRVHCSHNCRIEYHLYCWKRCKIKELQDKVEKDIMGLDCLTPDCIGCIWKVDIFQDSRQKTIECSKSKENKVNQNPETKPTASSFNLKKVTRKKERKHPNPGRLLLNIHQEQTDISNKKPEQNDLKDETVGARKKEGKTKNVGHSNEWMKNDKSRFLEEVEPKLNDNSYEDSDMTDYYQVAPKEEKVQNSNTNTYLDNVLQDENYAINLEPCSIKKNKRKAKVCEISQHKDGEHVTPSADNDRFKCKSHSPVNFSHSALLAEEQASSDNSYSKLKSLKCSSGPDECSAVSKNIKIKTNDATVLTDPIKPFESKKRNFLYLYHENNHLLQNYEKSQKLYVQLCADTQNEIKTFKEKHERLRFNEKKLREEFAAVKVQLETEKEKLHDQRNYQSQELVARQEELKFIKNNLERSKKAIHENETEVRKIKEEREKWNSDRKKLQNNCRKMKENCRESANRLLSVETQIQEWKNYTRLYFLNTLLEEAVENVKFYTTKKNRHVGSPDVIATCDMWEKRMKGIQAQITLAVSRPQGMGIYNKGKLSTSSCNLKPSQYKFEHQKYSANQQRLSPSPATNEMGQNVAFAGSADSIKGAWFSPGTRNIGLDAKPSLRTENDVYMSAAWPPSYSTQPTMQPNSAIDQLDRNQSDLELEFRLLAGKKRSFPLQLSGEGFEMPDVTSEEKSLVIPDVSLAALRTSHVSENRQNHLFEPSGSTTKSFNSPFNHLQSARAIAKSNKDIQALQTQRLLGGTSTANSSRIDGWLSVLAEPRSSYHAVMEQLFFKFPTTSTDVFHLLINKVKEENGGTLSGLSVIDLVRQVSRHVVQGTNLEMTYPTPSELFPFSSTNYENSFLSGHATMQPDLPPATPDRFSGLMSASADPLCFESLPLGDLLELEGSFDGL